MRVAFLCNISPRWKNRVPALMERLERLTIEKEIFTVDRSRADSLENHLRKIKQGSFDRIAVVGGDGTLNRAINTLHGDGVLQRYALGIIPFGTCNDFARHAGFLGGAVSPALDAVLGDKVGKLNLARINGKLFINNAGFGRKNPAERGRSSLAALRQMSPHSLNASWEDGHLEGKFLMMLCANAPFFSGGLHFSNISSPADDLLEFYFVRNSLKIGLAARLLLGRAGFAMRSPLLSKNIPSVQARKLSLVLSRPASFAVDGETAEELSSLTEATFDIGTHCRFVLQ